MFVILRFDYIADSRGLMISASASHYNGVPSHAKIDVLMNEINQERTPKENKGLHAATAAAPRHSSQNEHRDSNCCTYCILNSSSLVQTDSWRPSAT